MYALEIQCVQIPQEVQTMMTCFNTMSNHNSYCSTAAACTSAPECIILDTAILAVSIFIRLRKEL